MKDSTLPDLQLCGQMPAQICLCGIQLQQHWRIAAGNEMRDMMHRLIDSFAAAYLEPMTRSELNRRMCMNLVSPLSPQWLSYVRRLDFRLPYMTFRGMNQGQSRGLPYMRMLITLYISAVCPYSKAYK